MCKAAEVCLNKLENSRFNPEVYQTSTLLHYLKKTFENNY